MIVLHAPHSIGLGYLILLKLGAFVCIAFSQKCIVNTTQLTILEFFKIILVLLCPVTSPHLYCVPLHSPATIVHNFILTFMVFGRHYYPVWITFIYATEQLRACSRAQQWQVGGSGILTHNRLIRSSTFNH